MRHAAFFGRFRRHDCGFNGIACICLLLITLSGCGDDRPTYTVTYDDNVQGKTIDVPPASAALAEGSVVSLSSDVPERTGYTFAGWNTAPDGMGIGYAAGGTLTMGSADVTLYAQWTTEPTFAIFYEDNVDDELIGVPTGSTGYVAGTVVVLSSIVPERTGYAFAGWNTLPDGTGVVYAAGGTLTVNAADVTLYAQWTTGPTYAVLYEDNVDGELIGVPTGSTGYVAGTVVSLSSSIPVRAGYTFTSWNTARDGSGVTYVAGGTLTMGAGDTILYAQWTDIPVYTLTYDDNVDDETISVPRDDEAYWPGTTVSISTTVPLRSGYAFAGWNTLPDSTGGTYAAGASLIIGTADVTLYAQWEGALSVTYDANLPAETNLSSGSAPIDDTGYEDGDTVTVAGDNGMTVSDYGFTGWNSQADGQGTTYSESFTITSDTTLYARWAPAIYTVTYHHNDSDGGTAPTDDNIYAAGELVTVMPNHGDLVRAGHEFDCWNTTPDGDGDHHHAGGSAILEMPDDHLTLYARWLRIHNVSYADPSGESSNLPDASTYLESDASFTLDTAVPVRDGYVFEGWYTDASFGGTRYMPGDVYPITGNGDVTFHANWVVAGMLTATPSAVGASYTVRFDDNDDDDTTQVQSQTVGVGYTAVPPAALPVRAGFDFMGWYGNAALTRAYDFGTAVTGDTTLYARWKRSSCCNIRIPLYGTWGGVPETGPSQIVRWGESIIEPPVLIGPATPTLFMEFLGWERYEEPPRSGADLAIYVLDKPYDFNTPVTKTFYLYAKWIVDTHVYVVSFEDNDGDNASNQVKSQRVVSGDAAAEPAAPVKSGADFAGWYSDPALTTPYDFSTPVNSDITLYGRWIDRWTAGDLASSTGNTDWYYFDATAGSEYEIAWDDSADGSFAYIGDIKVTAYQGDLVNTYFSAIDDGYGRRAQRITATADERIYLKVEVNSGFAGTYALRFTRKYEVGDTGPGGGLIFYVDDGTYGTGTDGSTLWTYLEAAPARHDSQHHWGPYPTGAFGNDARGKAIPGSNQTALGTGYDNTLDFIASETTGPQVDANFGDEPIYYAAQQAAGLNTISPTTGGLFNDWFLPASDTLRAMYDALYAADYDDDGAADNIGEFADAQNASFYWASTEDVDLPCDVSCFVGQATYVNRAWSLDVGGSGSVGTGSQKSDDHYVRAVRRF